MKLGDPISKKLTSGRMFFKRSTDAAADGYIDLGNCLAHKLAPNVSRKEHMKSEGGIKQTDFSLVNSVSWKYELDVEEHSKELKKLLYLGTQGADSAQVGANVVGESLTTASVQGRTYFAAKMGLSAVTVKVGGIAKVEGTDYTIDLGSGAVRIIDGGGIANGATVTIDYTYATVTFQTFTALKELRVAGSFRYVETDQFADSPREVHTFDGQIQVTNWGENNLEDFNKASVEILCSTKPVINVRKD